MNLLYIHHRDILEDTANSIQVLQMCNAFGNAGIETTLLFPNKFDRLYVKEQIQNKVGGELKFKIILYSYTTPFNIGKSFISCFQALRSVAKISSNYQIFFTRHYLINHFMLRLKLNSIFEMHMINFTSTKILNNLIRKLIIKDSKNDYQKLVITISQKMKEYLLKNEIARSKTIALHDGFSKEKFSKYCEIPEARKKLGIDSKKKIVTYLGSLYKNRGIEVIIKLAEDNTDAEYFVIGGTKTQQEYYQSVAKKLDVNNILFMGSIPHQNVTDYLYASDVLLMIWSWEVSTIEFCSPLKVFEYMAAGRIIVGQKFPTIPEVLTDGENALLADPDSLNELKIKMKEALKMEYPNNLASNARQKAFEHYTWEKRVNEIKKSI